MSTNLFSPRPLAMEAKQSCEGHSHLSKNGDLVRTVDLLIKAFQDMLLKELRTHSTEECLISALQQRLSLLSKIDPDFYSLDQIIKADRMTDEQRDSIFEMERLKGDLEASEEECRQLHQALKHWGHEKRVAIDRARVAEDNLKKTVASAESDRKQAAQDRKKVQHLQAKVEELQLQLQQRSPTHDDGDAGKKATKEMGSPDITGLQRGLEKVKSQLKKKQDEFQSKVQALQGMTKKVKELEDEKTKDQEKIYDLTREIKSLKHIQQEESAENTSDHIRVRAELGYRNRQLEVLGRQFEAVKERCQEQQALLTAREHMLKLEKEKNKRLNDKISKLTVYEPLGDADIADRIRIRNLVDQVQERLAIAAGLTAAPGESLSLTWRLAIGPGSEDATRMQRAKELLPEESISPHDIAFLANEEALRHACQSYSRFRAPGNDLHKLLERTGYLTSLDRYLKHTHSEGARASLGAMVDYICPVSPPPSPDAAE